MENLQDIHNILHEMLKEVEELKHSATVYDIDGDIGIEMMDTMMKCSGDVIIRWLRLFR